MTPGPERQRGRVAAVDDEVDVEAPRELLREPVTERRQVDVGDVQDADLVTTSQRVGLDGRVRARGTRHDPAELVAEVPDALDRALDGTEELWHQPERARVGRRLERRRVVADRREPHGEDDRDEPRDRGSKDLEPSVPEREEPEGSRAGDTHQDHPSGEAPAAASVFRSTSAATESTPRRSPSCSCSTSTSRSDARR